MANVTGPETTKPDPVRYERGEWGGKSYCEAIYQPGLQGFAGRGDTFAEAHAQLVRNVAAHKRHAERALEEVEASTPPEASP